MKILIPQFHPGFTCMLCRCPHDFYVRRGLNPFPGDQWKDRIRPQPANLHVIQDGWGGPYDLAIVPMTGAPDDLPPVRCPFVYLHLWDGAPALHPAAKRSHAWVFLSVEVARRMRVENDPMAHVVMYGIDPAEHGGWTGGGPVVAIGHNLKGRGDKGYQTLAAVARVVPMTILGYGNEELPGHRYIDDYAEYLRVVRSASVFFNPSPWVPQSGAEMMVLGVPTVQVDPINYRSLYRNGTTCQVVQDARQAIGAIRFLEDSPRQAASLGENARAEAKAKFWLSRFIAQWERIFQGVRVRAPL